MGMIVTLFLISANVYNSVDAPQSRGFSYIEIWMLGSQFPILLALLEYGLILFLKKINKKFKSCIPIDLDNLITNLDFATLIFSFSSFVAFSTIYWFI